ncbi:hypothetical protein U1Q18_017602 [Sarracenia purpurea var. burkii]
MQPQSKENPRSLRRRGAVAVRLGWRHRVPSLPSSFPVLSRFRRRGAVARWRTSSARCGGASQGNPMVGDHAPSFAGEKLGFGRW